MMKIRVFLVDDHPVVREGIRRLLERETQIELVGEAEAAEEALEKVESCQPHVVLMDIRLPGIDGIEATRRFTAQHPDIKVIALSSFGQEYLAQAIEAGASGYVLKTSPPQELVQAVRQAASGQAPIDPALTSHLLGQFADLWKVNQSRGLSNRQHEALRLVAKGIPSKEITVRLAISNATLKREIKNIFNHLGVNDRAQAIAEAYNRKLL